MRAQVDRGLLAQREVPISRLPKEAFHFSSEFFQKASTEDGSLTYETTPVVYGKNTRHALPRLARQFENSLLHVNRGGGSERYFLVISPRKDLLSQEAVTFAVLLHLSNMVRYRPEQLEKVASERWSWLLSTWVPRALENALLTYSTRILQQEVRLVH